MNLYEHHCIVSNFTDEEEFLFFFYMLRVEDELHYIREINILLLLYS